MDALSPDQATTILNADFRNLVNKVKGGKTLTSAERQLIKARAAGDLDNSITEAKTVVELAAALGVNRRSITNWRKLDGAPVPKPNGLHDVVAWRAFLRSRQLNGEVGGNEETLRYRKLLAEVEERELKLAIRRGEFILREAVRRSWLERAGRVTSVLRAKLEKELPPILVGKDAPSIQELLSQAVDEILGELHEGESRGKSLTP